MKSIKSLHIKGNKNEGGLSWSIEIKDSSGGCSLHAITTRREVDKNAQGNFVVNYHNLDGWITISRCSVIPNQFIVIYTGGGVSIRFFVQEIWLKKSYQSEFTQELNFLPEPAAPQAASV